MQQQVQMRQSQNLSLSMQQSIKILQLPGYELRKYLEAFSYENPLLEVDFSLSAYDACSYGNDPPSPADHLPRSIPRSFCDPADFASVPFSEDSLSEYLKSQLPYHRLSESEIKPILILISALNPRGFFDEGSEEMAARLHMPVEQVRFAAEQIKKLEPAGVGARDLRECLLIQLERMACPDPVAIAALRDGYDLIAAGKTSQLAKRLGVSRDRLLSAMCVLKSLNPYPSNGFCDNTVSNYIVPDLVVSEEVRLNPPANPSVSLGNNMDGLSRIDLDADSKQFIKEKKREARFMIQAVNLRSNTLCSVAAAIVRIQHLFFETGRAAFVPMTLEAVSTMVNMHISIVSRAVSGKYLKCRWGVFPLKVFFSRGLASEAGVEGQHVSPGFVKQKIGELIASEDKQKPYSDQELCCLLEGLGINISRRCIAKYRQQLNIAVSYLRVE